MNAEKFQELYNKIDAQVERDGERDEMERCVAILTITTMETLDEVERLERALDLACRYVVIGEICVPELQEFGACKNKNCVECWKKYLLKTAGEVGEQSNCKGAGE